MSFETWLAFAAASAVLPMSPGPTILTAISYSLARGRRANVPLVAAITSVVPATVDAALCAVFAASARRVRSTPMAQRRFDVAGGALLSTTGIRALFARRSGAAA